MACRYANREELVPLAATRDQPVTCGGVGGRQRRRLPENWSWGQVQRGGAAATRNRHRVVSVGCAGSVM